MKKVISFILILTIIISALGVVYANPFVEGIRDGVNQVLDIKNEATKSLVNVGADLLISAINKFNDIKSHWGAEFIAFLNNKGIIDGYPDGTFKPDSNINVAEFTKVVTAALVGKDIGNSDTGNWYDSYVELAKELEIIKDGEFSLREYDREITREEMTRMVVRGLQENEITGNTSFTDDKSINVNMKGYVKKAVDLNVIAGYPDGTFKPQGRATRAEVSKLVSVMTDVMKDFRKIPSEEKIEEKPVEKKPVIRWPSPFDPSTPSNPSKPSIPTKPNEPTRPDEKDSPKEVIKKGIPTPVFRHYNVEIFGPMITQIILINDEDYGDEFMVKLENLTYPEFDILRTKTSVGTIRENVFNEYTEITMIVDSLFTEGKILGSTVSSPYGDTVSPITEIPLGEKIDYKISIMNKNTGEEKPFYHSIILGGM